MGIKKRYALSDGANWYVGAGVYHKLFAMTERYISAQWNRTLHANKIASWEAFRATLQEDLGWRKKLIRLWNFYKSNIGRAAILRCFPYRNKKELRKGEYHVIHSLAKKRFSANGTN